MMLTRLPVLRPALFLALTLAAPAAVAQESAAPSESEAAEASSFFKGLEASVDKGAGVVVDALNAVFFYELGASKTHVERPGTEQGIVALQAMIEELKGTTDPTEADLTLYLPASTELSDDELKELKTSLRQQLWDSGTTKAYRAFDVKLHEDESLTTTRLEALDHGLPLIVLWLVFGAVFFTFRMGFINLRGFFHAIQVTRGKYDNPDDKGEVSHFQALASALSATVGLGNIAGVAIAVSVGGPGAILWLIVAGLLGMSSKFTECTLGQKYREVRDDGRIMGGAMYYLRKGLGERGFGWLGSILAVVFAVFCIGGSLGGGNTFQVNQSLNALSETVPFLGEHRWVYGLIMAVMVGIVILGDIRRIAATAEKIVPTMCLIYVGACLYVILTHADAVPAAFGRIFGEAFTPEAGYGGFLGVLIMGFRRAAFSNEAGVGSAAIAHSAAKTEYPVREGIVALLEPFIDTIVVCTMTGLVIVITGAFENPEYGALVADNEGATLTSKAFEGVISWFPYVLSVAVVLFAYSTMISWSYYGERCWSFLFGDRSRSMSKIITLSYRIIFLIFVFLGSIVTSSNILDFGDLMILSMAFPNILGVLFLTGKVKRDLDDYWGSLKKREFKTYK